MALLSRIGRGATDFSVPVDVGGSAPARIEVARLTK
jgi:hypothetical protein